MDRTAVIQLFFEISISHQISLAFHFGSSVGPVVDNCSGAVLLTSSTMQYNLVLMLVIEDTEPLQFNNHCNDQQNTNTFTMDTPKLMLSVFIFS